MARTRKQYPTDFRTMAGVSMMSISQALGLGIIGMLMLYLTDYANLFPGDPGAAVAAATTLMVAGRVWDAINDPVLGFLMDRAPRTRWGRFKPFAMFAIPTSTILLIILFSLPQAMPSLTKLAIIYVLYFAFDACFTLMPFTPITQSLSPDARVRSKLLSLPRVFTLIFAALASAFVAVAIALGSAEEPSFLLATIVLMVPTTIVSMFGLSLVKEGRANVDEETVRVRDVFSMLRRNKPMWIAQLASICFGFVWNMLYIAAIYYVKYAFGVENLGLTSALIGLAMIGGNLLGVVVAQPLIKRVTPGQAAMLTAGATAIPLGILFFLNLAGPITNMPLFFSLIGLTTLTIGAGYIPGTLVTMECMDYNKYRLGKSLEGSLNSFVAFIQKLQGAMSTAVVGAVLVAVGYDATAYEDATTIPDSLYSGLGLAMFGIPAVLAIATAAIWLTYPLLRKGPRAEIYSTIVPGGDPVESVLEVPVVVTAGEATSEQLGMDVADEEKR